MANDVTTPATSPAAPAASDAGNTKPSEAPTTTQEKVVEPRKFKVKVDQQEMDVTEEDLIRNYQKGLMADKRHNEAFQMRQQAEQFIGMLKTPEGLKRIASDPRIGLDLRQFAQDILYEQYEEEQLTPEQKENREMKKRLAEITEREQEAKREQEQEQARVLQEQLTNQYTKDFIAALEKGGLPKTEHTIRRMAYYMHQSLQAGLDLKPIDVLELVRNDYISDTKSLFGGLDGETLISILGNEVSDKLRKHELTKYQQQQKPKPAVGTTAPASSPKKKKMSMDEWHEKLEKLKGS